MDGIFESRELATTPKLPATAVGAVLTVTAVLGSTPVVLEVTTEWETEATDNPETGRWLSLATTGVTEDGLEARPLDVKVLELAALAGGVDVAAEEAAALDVSLVSDTIPWLIVLCACSRANWTEILQIGKKLSAK